MSSLFIRATGILRGTFSPFPIPFATASIKEPANLAMAGPTLEASRFRPAEARTVRAQPSSIEEIAVPDSFGHHQGKAAAGGGRMKGDQKREKEEREGFRCLVRSLRISIYTWQSSLRFAEYEYENVAT